MLPNCLIIRVDSWAVWRLAIIAVTQSSINLHCPRISRLMNEFQRHSAVTVSSSSIRHPQGGSISPITEPDRESLVFSELCFRAPVSWYGQCLSVAKGTLLCQNHFGATYRAVAGSSFALLMSVWGVLATQISGRIPPWRPAQRCQSRLSGTSLWSRPTLNIAFKAYLSW